MKLHRLRVQNFASIGELEIAFGPGLNVLYGPNEIGKSTLADAIRLALLLPCTSNYYEPYISWSGADDPRIELTFETEEQRIWRVQKQFGRRGTALLQESRDGKDFADAERGRAVDARLREILRWGIPEPGGSGAGKGLPASFLATALLSTQAAVTDVLEQSLSNDPTATGKEQIAAALEAVAQDPLFVALLREAQAHRDEAYTEKGAKKTARGSVFKLAADRVRETQAEKESLEKIVEESEGVERHLRELAGERERCEEERVAAEDHLAAVALLAQQAVDRAAAEKEVQDAREEVLRIRKMDAAVAEGGEQVRDLAGRKEQAERVLQEAQAAEATAAERRSAAEDAARSAGLDAETADTMARQTLELRRAAAEKAEQAARQRVEAAVGIRKCVDAATRAEEEHRRQEAEAARAGEKWMEATGAEQAASEALRRCDLLERGLEVRAAEKRIATAQAEVAREAALQEKWTQVSGDRSAAADRRAALAVPPAGSLAALRKLETELASARGALEVGLVMTVIPTAILNLRVRKDGVETDARLMAQPLEVEADREVEVDIADLVTVRVRGGRREAQERVRALEDRWQAEVAPHLTAAGVADLEALAGKVDAARELDAQIQTLDGDLDSLRRQIADLAGAAEVLGEASAREAACRQELGDVELESLAADLDALGADPGTALRTRRQKASRDLDTARTATQAAATARTLAEERVRSAKESLDAAVEARDAALADLPAGVEAEAEAAEQALRAAQGEQEAVTAELASLQDRIAARKEQLDTALNEARKAAEEAGRAVETARDALRKAGEERAAAEARLHELIKQREAENLAAAESRLDAATGRQDALPVPERLVRPEEVLEAKAAVERVKQSLETLNREIHVTQGRLQQVGGNVAADRLRDAAEAFELALLQEREIEADSEAWKLLLEQMKEADEEQAGNLGRALAPAIEHRFQALTRQRYGTIQLTAQLKMEGVVLAGAMRTPEEMSVGTREQLSTLYRLCLGEYLRTAIVLDDQLVQSDDTRMEWFRALLAEKARTFQIVVLTCRPGDYLEPEAMVGEEGVVYAESGKGFVRAIDLGRVVGR